LQERIIGTECEYALFHQLLSLPADARRETDKLRGGTLIENLKKMSALLVCALTAMDVPAAGEFLGNGGRFYIDRGSHPEYATPECRNVEDLIAHEKAGDTLVQKLVEAARLIMEQNGIPGKLHAFKNNLDPHGNTYGSHENYLITPKAMEEIRKIIPFLLTRQIFTGAGKLAGSASRAARGQDCLPFSVSQRADFIDTVFNDRATETRGIINTRKREITRRDENIRLHVILGDSNMSEYALELKVGTTALILRVLEEDGLHMVPMFSKPVDALKAISHYPPSVHEVDGRSGGYTALDVQFIYLEKAQRFFASHAASPAEKAALNLWERTLVGLKNFKISYRTGVIEDDPDGLRRKLDWVIKLWLLNRAREKKALDWSDPHLLHLDFRYHDLDPQTGLFLRCATLELVDRVIEEDKVCLALTDPPPDTRAWMRGKIIREASRKNVDVIVENWESIKIVAKGDDSGRHHPFERQKRLINGLKADLTDPFERCNTALLAKVSRFIERCDA